MSDRDLRLNSLSRYSKQSPRFVLEEHGHCEVPAGCGGVVLRWRNPAAGVPVGVRLVVDGEATFYLDGVRPVTSRPTVGFGAHTIALRISSPPSGSAALLLACAYNEDDMLDTRLSRRTGIRHLTVSEPDGSWRWSPLEPVDDNWLTTEFDDSDWAPMVELPLTAEAEERHDYVIRQLRELGARPLGVDAAVETIWVRKVFTLSRGAGGQ